MRDDEAASAREAGLSFWALAFLLIVSVVNAALRKLCLWPVRIPVSRLAMRWVPGSPHPHVWLADTYLRSDRWEEAVSPLRAAWRLDPEDVDTVLKLGQTLSMLKRYEEARDVLRDAPKRSPDDPWAHACLGQALAGLGRRKEAQECYRAALRLSPGDGEILALAKQAGLRGSWLDRLIASGEFRR
jgi:tetratricopeptide (TPR) repeat protein